MTDQPDEDAHVEETDTVEPADDGSPSTGHPAVDEVLRSLDELDGRPVDEHVVAFERAHETLRRTLSGAADEPADETAGGTGDVGTTPTED
jgi:hypothetical protein